MTARYYVVSVSGYPAGSKGSGSARLTTSYSVLDSAYAHREVFTRYHGAGQRQSLDHVRRRACEQEAERLNLLDQAHMEAVA